MLKIILCSGVLYGYYMLALRNSTLHVWNRYFLILATLLSLLLPFIVLPQASVHLMPTVVLPVFSTVTATHTDKGVDLFFLGYSVITGFLLCRIVYNIGILLRRRRVLAQYKDYTLLSMKHAPFSFFHFIFWDERISPESAEGAVILRHELAHIKGYHSADKLLMEVISAFAWFNPFFYLMKKELAMVHEFIADKAAAANAPAAYAKSLLQQTLQSSFIPGTSSFFQSPIKRRISMLFHNKTHNTIMKKTIIFPIATALVLFLGTQQPANVLAQSVKPKADTNKVYTSVDTPPEFPGGMEAMAKFLTENVHYPAEAKQLKIEGTVYGKFVVAPDGSIYDVGTIGKDLGYGLEEETVRVIQALPKFKPGIQNGKKVYVQFILPVKYQLQK